MTLLWVEKVLKNVLPGRSLRGRLCLCITKCYKFLTDGEFKNILNRIANIIRGVGDPLVAVWVRVYLARVGKRTLPDDTSFVKSALFDYLFTWSQFPARVPP